MAYFKIGDNDYSMYINTLEITKSNKYNSQTNAAGDSVVDYQNAKREIKIGIIPLDDAAMVNLLADIDAFGVSISFRDPRTNALAENVSCIVPSDSISYYTIQADKATYKAFNLSFIEL